MREVGPGRGGTDKTVVGLAEARVSAGKLVHAITDTCAAHKYPKVREWLTLPLRWMFHFTPNSAASINAAEGLVAKLSR